MYRGPQNDNQELQINLQQLISAVYQRIWLIAAVAVVGALLGFWISRTFITPKYEATALFYVDNSSVTVGDSSIKVDVGDLSAAKHLVDSYIVILESRETLLQVAEYTGVDLSHRELQDMISANAVNGTEIFQVTVRSPSRYQADRIADGIAGIFPERISELIEGTSCKVVERAVVPASPSYPSHLLNCFIGFVIGLFGALFWVIGEEFLDVTIREEGDIVWLCRHPILAAIPDMTTVSKGGYYGYADAANSKKPEKSGTQQDFLGQNMSFAATEAYKLLRTKLQFSFADDARCHVVCVSSAMAGEGKSLSVLNLAYSLAQLDQRVLVVDCDMRRPTTAAKLKIKKSPGLSNYLTGQSELEEVVQRSGQRMSDTFDVITAGRNPPNPVELLSSFRMKELLDILRKKYDYILLDLPPVGEVSDALTVANWADGVLLVARQNYCNRNVFSAMVQQFAYMGSNVLGIVYNCSTEGGGIYTRRYHRRYRRGYEGYYASDDKKKRT